MVMPRDIVKAAQKNLSRSHVQVPGPPDRSFPGSRLIGDVCTGLFAISRLSPCVACAVGLGFAALSAGPCFEYFLFKYEQELFIKSPNFFLRTIYKFSDFFLRTIYKFSNFFLRTIYKFSKISSELFINSPHFSSELSTNSPKFPANHL